MWELVGLGVPAVGVDATADTGEYDYNGFPLYDVSYRASVTK